MKNLCLNFGYPFRAAHLHPPDGRSGEPPDGRRHICCPRNKKETRNLTSPRQTVARGEVARDGWGARLVIFR